MSSAVVADKMYGKIFLIVCLLFAVESSDARRAHGKPYAGPIRRPTRSQDSENQFPAECMTAMIQAHQECGQMPTVKEQLGTENDVEIYNKLVEMDLRDICRPHQRWFQCFSNAMEPCAAVNNPILGSPGQMLAIARTFINYVCEQEVEAFNRHKACLLELEDDVNDSPKPEFKLVIKGSLNRTCHEQLQQFVQLPGELCPLGSQGLQTCAKQVVAEQCGNEIASVLDVLADRVRTAADCQSSRLRSRAHLKRRGFPSYTHPFKFLKSFF